MEITFEFLLAADLFADEDEEDEAELLPFELLLFVSFSVFSSVSIL